MIINVIDFDMSIQDAVDAPRMDHEWMPDILRLERQGLPKGVIEQLKAMGHHQELYTHSRPLILRV